jgi:flagellar motor switch protein FliN/FliY
MAEAGEAARRLVEEWSTRLGQVLESMADTPPRVTWKPGEADLAAVGQDLAASHGELLWWEQAFTVLPEPVVWVGVPAEAWKTLGLRILEAAGIEHAEAAEARSTFQEVLGQSLESLAHALGGYVGGEVNCTPGRERPDPPPVPVFFQVELHLENIPLPPLLVAFGAPLLEAVERAVSGRQLVRQPAAADTRETEGTPEAAPAASGSKVLDLLLDVELPVTISFGRAQLCLKDALKLTTGSVVELNRTVAEPVEVIVNNCVIARGEVVVVEGNYGVRIREIMSRHDRLRTLR